MTEEEWDEINGGNKKSNKRKTKKRKTKKRKNMIENRNETGL